MSAENNLTGLTPEQAALTELLERVQRLERLAEQQQFSQAASQVVPLRGVVR